MQVVAARMRWAARTGRALRRLALAVAAAGRWLKRETLDAPLEPVLHPTRGRLILWGACYLVGHPLYWYIWARWLPQPYESLWARLAVAACGLPLVLMGISGAPSSKVTQWLCNGIFWVGLPFFFGWMFWMNGGNAVWLASVVAVVFVYFYATDWRIACAGVLSGAIASWAVAQWTGAPSGIEAPLVALVVVGFSLALGSVLRMSSDGVWRSQIQAMTATVGIMAHELRTPLATMSMIGDALRADSAASDAIDRQRVQLLAQRLNALVRNMNHQIDLQIANARLMHLPEGGDVVDAAGLVAAAVQAYPFRSPQDRASVDVDVVQNFRFRGSEAQFHHVIDNLLKNALRALAARGEPPAPGDLRIVVEVAGHKGRIEVADRGIGVPPALAARLFEPFFSTDRGTGHGLGLAFCRRVARAAGGDIGLLHGQAPGATFRIEVPILR
ncbi:MAG: sensor histidine kinase [Betaproteobacteria bacterium]